jgi:hypothetical protein
MIAPPAYGCRMVDPGRAMSPAARAEIEKAKKLVMYSHIFGWGGLGALIVLTPLAFAALGGIAGAVVALLALGSTITGAVLGQIGRAMQGRVI